MDFDKAARETFGDLMMEAVKMRAVITAQATQIKELEAKVPASPEPQKDTD